MIEFENALRNHSVKDPQYELLWAQWTYDKRLVARALQSVGVLFPHYSLHDDSHSNTILRQLARVLGPGRIARLSPTDIWLLLEAAYLHDIGMVVPDAKKKAWWRDNAFRVHLSQLRESVDQDLRSAAEILMSRDLDNLGDDWPFDVQRALLLAMADFARQRHPGMAEEIISTPDMIGLESPRALIPRRIFQLLGLICRHHGSSFEMALELPGRESGYGTDEAHPRFIACMLRLGDLLDLDDGRFCPVLMATMGRLPPSSQAHERKHASIRHLLVSPARIDVEAVCAEKDVAAFEEAERWLSWLRDELKNQAARWAEIAPTEDFGALPSVGRITAKIEGHLTLQDGRLSRFEVDRDAIIKLIRGANLYEHPTSFLRELLQNAVDATLLRFWREHRRKILGWEKDPSSRDQVIELLRHGLKRYPIHVKVTPCEKKPADSATGVNDHFRFKVVIDDRGMGISRRDISFLQQVGGSSKNPRKQQRRVDMPEWMQPSGIFGIGLQSVFLFAKRVVITTRPDDSPEILRITLRQGLSGRAGQIMVKELDHDHKWKHPGTRIECEIEAPLIPDAVFFSTAAWETTAVLADFDGVRDPGLLYMFALAKDEVRLFARESLCRIKLNNEALVTDIRTEPRPRRRVSLEGKKQYFDRETNVELRIKASTDTRFVDLRYRGAETKIKGSLESTLFAMEANLHFSQADEILSLNRESVRHDRREVVREKIDKALLHVFPRYYQDLRSNRDDPPNTEELQAASLYAALVGQACVPPVTSYGEWRGATWIKGASLGAIEDRETIEIEIKDSRYGGTIAPHIDESQGHSEQNEPMLRIVMNGCPRWLWDLFALNHTPVLVDMSAPSKRVWPGGEDWSIYRFYRKSAHERAPLAGDNSLRSVLRSIVPASSGVGYRNTMPCPQSFNFLQITEDPPYSSRLERALSPRMICPFSIKQDAKLSLPDLAAVVRWTVRYNRNEHVHALRGPNPEKAYALVASALMRFIEHAHRLMEAEWTDRKAYDLARARHELIDAFGPTAVEAEGSA